MELDETGDEETAEVLDWMIRALVDGRDKQVLLTAVAVHDREEERDFLILKLRVHKSVEEEAADVKRHLTLERVNKDLIRGLPVCEVGLDPRQRLNLKTTGENFKREPLVAFFFFCENRKTLNHEASPKSLQEGQSSLCVDEDGAHLGGVLVDGNHCALEGERGRGERQEVRKGRDEVMGGRQRRGERRNTGRRKVGSKSKQKRCVIQTRASGGRQEGKNHYIVPTCTCMYMHISTSW